MKKPRIGALYQRGQSMVEYAVVTSLLLVVFFKVEFGGRTTGQMAADYVRLFFRNLTHFLSLP